jgi:superfamily I DNA/RNA helicase
LVPDERVAEILAGALSDSGLPARFQKGADLDLEANEIKVIPIRSAKGLEFPVVALAGFHHSPPRLPRGDAQGEVAARERRALYMAMTRAMRALLVALPAEVSSPLFTGFEAPFWHLPGKEETP